MSLVLLMAAAAVYPATEACQTRVGALGTTPDLPQPIDGTLLRKAGELEKLRKRAKEGALLIVKGGDFSGWDFRKQKLGNICFMDAKLAKSDWRGVRMPGLGFIDTDLSQGQLAGATLPQLLLRTATLAGADATGANLDGVRVDGGWNASFAGLKLDRASVRGAVFACGTGEADGCPFDRQGMSARGADFRDAVFNGYSWWSADLEGARFDNAQLAIDDLAGLASATMPTRLRVGIAGTLVDMPGDVAIALGRMVAVPPATTAAPVTSLSLQSGGTLLYVRSPVAALIRAEQGASAAIVAKHVAQSASVRIALRADAQGRIAVRGAAVVGGRACRFQAPQLVRSPAGYALPGQPRRRAEPLLSIEAGKISLTAPVDAARRSAGAPGCTDAAQFGTLVPLAIDAATFETVWNDLMPTAN